MSRESVAIHSFIVAGCIKDLDYLYTLKCSIENLVSCSKLMPVTINYICIPLDVKKSTNSSKLFIEGFINPKSSCFFS